MILIKYLIFYLFVGVYQTAVFTRSVFKKTFRFFSLRGNSRYEKRAAMGFKTSLLRTAFRSIL
jgi:hypothetical protein